MAIGYEMGKKNSMLFHYASSLLLTAREIQSIRQIKLCSSYILFVKCTHIAMCYRNLVVSFSPDCSPNSSSSKVDSSKCG